MIDALLHDLPLFLVATCFVLMSYSLFSCWKNKCYIKTKCRCCWVTQILENTPIPKAMYDKFFIFLPSYIKVCSFILLLIISIVHYLIIHNGISITIICIMFCFLSLTYILFWLIYSPSRKRGYIERYL